VLVLSDRAAGPDRLPIPSLLALGAVHQQLLRTQLRPSVALFVECGDAREVHDFCTLLGFGADGICPYLAFDTLSYMNANGSISARALDTFTDEELQRKYRKAAAKGILKVMAKMGISTLQSYKGAQVFEALGLSAEVMNRCFTGTASRIGGATFATLLQDVQRRHNDAYPAHTDHIPALANTGQFHLRHGGEAHLNTPEGMTALQLASALNSQQKYQEYVLATDRQNRAVTLRGLLRFKFEGAGKVKVWVLVLGLIAVMRV
jgi:glutamate synthase domain-containing protein 2